eukprot:12899058-Prorocentrum_lima.AAC.1
MVIVMIRKNCKIVCNLPGTPYLLQKCNNENEVGAAARVSMDVSTNSGGRSEGGRKRKTHAKAEV